MPTTKTRLHLRPVPMPPWLTADSNNLWNLAACDFANRIAAAVQRAHSAPVPVLRREAKAALVAWVAFGPRRADGRARFTLWNGLAALAAMVRRIESPTLNLRRRALPFLRAPRDCWRFVLGCVASAARRWQERRRAGAKRCRRVFTVPPTVTLSPWQQIASAFVKDAAERHATMTATWGRGPAHRQRLAGVALIALQVWQSARERRGCDVGAVLLDRTARAEAAHVDRFALWPSSLLCAVRRALAREGMNQVYRRVCGEVFA